MASPLRHSHTPSDTIQPHAQDCRDPLAFLTAVIAKMHARRSVQVLTFNGVGHGQDSGWSSYSFEELVYELPGQLPLTRWPEGVHDGADGCEFPLGDARALGDEGRVHSSLESVEVPTELLAGFAGSEPRRNRDNCPQHQGQDDEPRPNGAP